MKSLLRSTLTAFALITLATACSTLKVDSWADPAFANRPLGKAMVVGVTDSEGLQRQYEGLFVSALQEAGAEAEAVASSDHFAPDARLEKDILREKLTAEGVTSLLVTRVIDEKEKAQYHSPVAYPSFYNNYFGYYSYTFDYVHSPGYVTSYIEIHLETNLYDVESGKLVWSGRKKITDDRSDEKNMKRVVEATVNDLGKRNLL